MNVQAVDCGLDDTAGRLIVPHRPRDVCDHRQADAEPSLDRTGLAVVGAHLLPVVGPAAGERPTSGLYRGE